MCEVELRRDHGLFVRRLRDDEPPRIGDQRAPVRGLAGQRLADLGSRRDVELVLDRPRAQQHVPVVFPGGRREVGGYSHELGAFEGEDPVQLREANVVADRQPELPVLDLCNDGLLARLLRLGLAVDNATDLDVEQMDLAVCRNDLAFRIEHK